VTKAVETPVNTSTPEVDTTPQPSLFTEDVVEATDVEPVVEEKEIEEEKIVHNLDDAPLTENVATTTTEDSITSTADAASMEENKQKAREAFLERQSQVKRTLNDVKMKLRLPGRIADIENEPAFKRRNVTLDDISHSSESSVSHFSINEEVDENGERKIELRDDNPFLHDNVD